MHAPLRYWFAIGSLWLRGVALAWLVSGCAGTVKVAPAYPAPVVAADPEKIGVFYSPAFRTWKYHNEDSGVDFELGSKQLALFDAVFQRMFPNAVSLKKIRSEASPLAWQIKPVTTEYAFLAPKDTDTDFYAISIKYRLEIYSSTGEHVADWPLVAYGRSRGKFLYWKESLGEATTYALRDAAAALVSGFGDFVAGRKWQSGAGSK